MRILFTLFVFGLFLCSPVMANEVTAHLDEKLEALRVEHDISAMSIAVIRDNKVFYETGFGYIDDDKIQKATATTRYRIASISKLFTAQAIMQLVENQKLSLDDNIGKYLPLFEGKDILLRHLLTHSAGLQDEVRPKDDDRTLSDYLTEVAGEEEGMKGGSGFSYSDTGFNLLGAIIQKITERDFRDYVDDQILAKNGFLRSGYYRNALGTQADAKAHYRGIEIPSFSRRPIDPAFAPSEGVIANVHELAIWLVAVMNKDGKIMSRPFYNQMLVPQVKTTWGDIHIGLGWQLYNTDNKGPAARHAGSVRGYKSLLVMYPKIGRGVIILSNEHETPRWDFLRAIEKILDQDE